MRLAARTADPIPPASRTWLSLIRNASYRPKRWFVPPPTRTAYFSSARSAGRGLPRVEDRDPAAGCVDEASSERGDARQTLQEVERDPLGGEQRARGPSHLADDGPRLARRALVGARRQHGRRIDELEDCGGDLHSSDDERGFGEQHAVPARARRHGGVRRDVARPDVFGQRAADEIAIGRLGEGHTARTTADGYGAAMRA